MLLKRKEEKSKLPEGWQLCSRRKMINMGKFAFIVMSGDSRKMVNGRTRCSAIGC